VSREIKRNSDRFGYLYASEAHERSIKRKHKALPKLKKYPALRQFVIAKLNERWSPKTIAGRWNLLNKDTQIGHEAIYQWIYGKDGESLSLKKLLIRSRKKRGLRRKPQQGVIKNKVSVHKRPDSINSRAEAGHFEGDLIFHKGSQSQNVLTLIDRKTRVAILIKNDNKRSETVLGALIRYLRRFKIKIRSLTLDNGSEFAEHELLRQMGIEVFFCDPGSPWQKGSIENLNGLIRRFLPFNMSPDAVTPELIQSVNRAINNMPRAILGYLTPLEFANAAFA